MTQKTLTLEQQPFLFQCLLHCGFANLVLGLGYFSVLILPVRTLWLGSPTDWAPLSILWTCVLGLSWAEFRIKKQYFPVFSQTSWGAIFTQSLPVLFLHFGLLAEAPQSCHLFSYPLLYYGLGLLGLIVMSFQNRILKENSRLFQGLRYVVRSALLGAFLLSLFFVWSVSRMRCEGNPISTVKANMHTLQAMVEIYREEQSSDPRGQVPQTLADLKAAGTQSHYYWKAALNPYQGEKGIGHAYVDFAHFVPGKTPAFHPVLGFRLNPDYCCAGFAVYKPLSTTDYLIYGTNEKGEYILDKGSPLVLSAEVY